MEKPGKQEGRAGGYKLPASSISHPTPHQKQNDTEEVSHDVRIKNVLFKSERTVEKLGHLGS